MNHYKKLQRRVSLYLFLGLMGVVGVGLGAAWALGTIGVASNVALGLGGVVALMAAAIFGYILTLVVLEPLHKIQQGILHVASPSQTESAPDLEKIRLGHELVKSLLLQVYELGSKTEISEDGEQEHRSKIIQSANIVSHMPIPLFVFNKEQLVTNASNAGLEYCNIESSALFGKKLYDSIKLEFPSDNTLESWITECQDSKVTDTQYWERVRVQISGNENPVYKRCDIAAYYNRDNPSGTEFIVTFFDRTELYQQDDDNMSFVALAVHELRTPITMLRGYVEVLNDELGDKLNEEMANYMHKMDYSTKQLTAFVNNILNVARIDKNALTLKLAEVDWKPTLLSILEDMQLKAKVQNKTIAIEIPDGLPTVAVDRVSIYEVVNNLVDNALKYSGESKQINIKVAAGKDGMIETTVQDFGVGIPESVVPNLFEKFYRNHRTKAKIGGTGLGLYLSKALVNAHGGQVWVSSKEGQGSTFGFSLVPFAQLSEEHKGSVNTEITRTAHGWIKNHSMYRR